MSEYHPISCDTHSQLELLIMHRTPCEWHYRDCDQQNQVFYGIATDLFTRDHQEFLSIQNPDSTIMTLRLDKILQFIKSE